MGAQVTILYRRERKDMPAIDEEIQAAEDEGVRFVFLAAPHRILGDADGNVKAIEIVKTRLGEYDKSGRRRPIPTDEVQRFECDSVILAVGETFDLDFCRASGLALKEEGTIVVDRFTLRDQPAQLLCRRRRDHRRIQRLQRHGRRQAGGAEDRRAPDGRSALGEALSRSSNTAARRRESRASAAATRRTPCPRRSASVRSRKWLPASIRRRRWKNAAAACAAI